MWVDRGLVSGHGSGFGVGIGFWNGGRGRVSGTSSKSCFRIRVRFQDSLGFGNGMGVGFILEFSLTHSCLIKVEFIIHIHIFIYLSQNTPDRNPSLELPNQPQLILLELQGNGIAAQPLPLLVVWLESTSKRVKGLQTCNQE